MLWPLILPIQITACTIAGIIACITLAAPLAKVVDPESHQLLYGDLGWPHLSDSTEFHSPTATNGAGFSVWFSPSKHIAYERVGYW